MRSYFQFPNSLENIWTQRRNWQRTVNGKNTTLFVVMSKLVIFGRVPTLLHRNNGKIILCNKINIGTFKKLNQSNIY